MSFGAFIVRVGVEAAVHDRFVHRFWHEPERTIDLGAGEVPDHLECHRYVFTVYRLVYARLRDAHLPGYLTLRLATHEGERDPGELARWDEPSPHARRPELLLRLPRDRDRSGRERLDQGVVVLSDRHDVTAEVPQAGRDGFAKLIPLLPECILRAVR